MPDVFVPRDTSMNSKFLFELYSKNIIREYALRYVNEHKKALAKQTFPEYLDTFKVTDAMMDELIADAKKGGIKLEKAAVQSFEDYHSGSNQST